LLPRFRGPSPIQYPILEGDAETGVSIMQVDEGIDTGPILLQEKCFLNATETASSLHDRLSELGVTALVTALKRLQNQETITPILQGDVGACYAPKVTKEMAKLDWKRSAVELDRMVRAFNYWPVAYTTLNNEIVRVLCSQPLTEKTSALAGRVIRMNDDSLDVATGCGVLRVQELQFPGGKRLPVKEILNSKRALFHRAIFV
jgi:methionyl-tRNA formyltransferase